jgi:nucleoid DNA-binding protein
MIKDKISSQEIIDLIALKASVSKRAAEEFLKVMIASVEDGLLAGESVKIKSFGTFKLQWNEPRKSVNVQTGDEIKIEGYYKVVFIPDSALKEQVNEPFAHLEPVELDADANIGSKKNEFIEENELLSDPLRIFNEQATEIKNLISEIQALSAKPVPEIKVPEVPEDAFQEEAMNDDSIPVEETAIEPVVVEEIIAEPVYVEASIIDPDVVEDKTRVIIEQEQLLEIQSNTPNDEVEKRIDEVETVEQYDNQALPYHTPGNIDESVSNPNPKEETQLFSELEATPYLENIKPVRKRRIWLWAFILLFLLSGSGSLFYLYSSDSEFSTKYSLAKMSENISISDMLNTITKWFAPASKPVIKPVTIVIPKDTSSVDSISEIQPVDTLQILFDNPRVYSGFIASERISSGNRLTIISKRYYGSKDFWVYIYEANKDRISDPDNIAVGTIIRIPELDPKLIDVSNPRCIQKAKELHDIYVK